MNEEVEEVEVEEVEVEFSRDNSATFDQFTQLSPTTSPTSPSVVEQIHFSTSLHAFSTYTRHNREQLALSNKVTPSNSCEVEEEEEEEEEEMEKKSDVKWVEQKHLVIKNRTVCSMHYEYEMSLEMING